MICYNPPHMDDVQTSKKKMPSKKEWRGFYSLILIQAQNAFNEKAAQYPDVKLYAVSLDLPFAQARWCGANGVNAVTTLSDYRDRDFGRVTGTLIQELSLLTRAIFLVDDDNVVRYVEYVPEITDHPDYDTLEQKLNQVIRAQ